MKVSKAGKAVIASSVAGLIVFCVAYFLSIRASIFIWGPVQPPFMAIVEVSFAAVLAIITGPRVLFIFGKKPVKLSSNPKKIKK